MAAVSFFFARRAGTKHKSQSFEICVATDSAVCHTAFMHATQKAIAQRLGVSVSLVSRALRGEGERIGASPDTIRRICEEAARCGYAPNLTALSLRVRSNLLLGVVVRDFADPFFGPLLGALQQLAAEEPACSLVMTGGSGDQAPFGRYRFDGVILIGSDFQPSGFDHLMRARTPVVRVGDGPADEPIAQVRVAQASGFASLLSYLRDLGHRRIGYLDNGTPASARRAELLRAALRQAGMPAPAASFVSVADTQPATLVAAVRRLALHGGPDRATAVVAADDVLALLLLRSLHEAGVRVPRDLSIAGVDDIPFSALAVPALTTLRAPIAALAGKAFRLALGREAAGMARMDVQSELIVRESCAAQPR